MATATKKCRVCGEEYEACHTLNKSANINRWQDVACSPECGTIYFTKIEESRKNDSMNTTIVEDTGSKHKDIVESDYYVETCESEDDEDEDDYDIEDEDDEDYTVE